MTRRAGITVGLAAVALVLAGCAGEPVETTPTTAPAPTAIPTTPAPTASADPDAAPDAPTCETIIPAATVEDFESVGWSVQSDEFRIGGTEVPGGIHCTWGDYSVATDHVQIFGWAPIEAAQAGEAQDELLASGWRREEGDGGFYVTEAPESAIATDEDGYGFTYFFGDGWVKLADTKQSLVLVEWPPR